MAQPTTEYQIEFTDRHGEQKDDRTVRESGATPEEALAAYFCFEPPLFKIDEGTVRFFSPDAVEANQALPESERDPSIPLFTPEQIETAREGDYDHYDDDSVDCSFGMTDYHILEDWFVQPVSVSVCPTCGQEVVTK